MSLYNWFVTDGVEGVKCRRPATVSGPRAECQPLVLPPRPVTAAPRTHTPLHSGTLQESPFILVLGLSLHLANTSSILILL